MRDLFFHFQVLREMQDKGKSYFCQSVSISVGQGTANPVPCRELQTPATQKSHRSSVFTSVQTGAKGKPCFTRMNTNVPALTSNTEALHHIIPPDCALEAEIDKPRFHRPEKLISRVPGRALCTAALKASLK